jgi:hypothetical protein
MFAILGVIVSAAILGFIIAGMERDEFPGWSRMILCVLAAVVPAGIINAFLPPAFFLVGLVVGAICAGLAISALTGMSVKRASIAASIYLAIQAVIDLAFLIWR